MCSRSIWNVSRSVCWIRLSGFLTFPPRFSTASSLPKVADRANTGTSSGSWCRGNAAVFAAKAACKPRDGAQCSASMTLAKVGGDTTVTLQPSCQRGTKRQTAVRWPNTRWPLERRTASDVWGKGANPANRVIGARKVAGGRLTSRFSLHPRSHELDVGGNRVTNRCNEALQACAIKPDLLQWAGTCAYT